MTPFTDEDLKQLKEGSKTLEPDILGLRPKISLFPEEILALLARLEAAEKIIGIFVVILPYEFIKTDEMKAWGQSKGEK